MRYSQKLFVFYYYCFIFTGVILNQSIGLDKQGAIRDDRQGE